MDKANKFMLKLTGDGMQIDREVTPEVARAILNLILGGVPAESLAVLPPTGTAPGTAGGSTPALSVREFLEAHKAKRIPEQIASIALFLKKHQGASVFTKKELVKSFEDAQEPVPANLSRDISWTVKNGWIAPKTGTKNSFYITGTGETAVNAHFPDDIKKKTKVSLKPRKKRKPKTAAKTQ